MLSSWGAREDSWVPWTPRRSNQSILKEINPEYSLERLMLKLQYFGHWMRRVDSLEKALMLGKIEGRRRREWQKMRCLDSTTDSMGMSLNKLCKIVKDREGWHAAAHGVTKNQTWLSEWTITNSFTLIIFNTYNQECFLNYLVNFWCNNSMHSCFWKVAISLTREIAIICKWYSYHNVQLAWCGFWEFYASFHFWGKGR